MSVNQLFFLLILILGINSCQDKPLPKDEFPNAQTIQLIGVSGSIKLPKVFYRTSLSKLSNDIPYLQTDTMILHLISNLMNEFSIEDKDLDLLVDTTNEMSFLIFVESLQLEINEEKGRSLDKEFTDHFKQLAEENLFLEIHKIDSKLKINEEDGMLKYKYEFVNSKNLMSYYKTMFIISNHKRSLMIIQISLEGNDIENYISTLKG